MKILSIETSGNVCGVALTEDNNLIKEKIRFSHLSDFT